MYGSSRFNLLVVALITFISFVTARTVITSQTCATRYCGYPVPKSKIYKTTKTIHKSARYTVTRWKTVNKPKYTSTVTKTTTTTSQRISTISTVTIINTIWIGTTTHTRKFTVTSPSSTETIPATTITISSTYTVPAPSGFVGVNDDPANKGAQQQPARARRDIETDLDNDLDRRNANPEPEPVPAAAKYVTAITCTKTLITKTGTSDLWKTTTKTTGTTTKTLWSTQTSWPDIKTITMKGAKTVRLTTSKYKVAFASSTSTVTQGVSTTFLTTVTERLPVETFHAACGARNQSPRPDQREGLGWAAYQMGPDQGEGVYQILSNGTAYDCCVECHTYSRGGVCIGTVWRSNIWGGDPGPSCVEDPECNWEPFEPEFRSTCNLIIAASGAPALCRRHGYNFYSMSTEYETAVSNGLSCQRYKFGKWFL